MLQLCWVKFLMEITMENTHIGNNCECNVISSQSDIPYNSKDLYSIEQCSGLSSMDASFGDITLTDAERQRCEIWTRVMGYYRPKDSFNIGKKQEADERKYFKPVCNTEMQTNASSLTSDSSNLEQACSVEQELSRQQSERLTQQVCPDCITRAA